MGNNIISGSQSIEISLKHPKISHAKLITSSNRQILKVSMPSDQENYKKWKDALHKFKHFQHEHLLLPLNHKFLTKGFCASTGDVEIDFPNNSVLLSQEITNRQAKNLAFTESQLWYLLYALLSAKSYLPQSTKGYPYELIGDVRPQNVFISPQGQVRFVNLLSWPGQKINYAKTFDGIATYLSPEDYENLQLGKLNNESNQNSSQNFSIGLTLISSALLIDNSDLYDIHNQKFNQYEAQRRINAFKVNKSYSELLRAVVGGLCDFQPIKRLAWSEIWNWIRKYEKKISQKKEFPVDQLPSSINQHISSFRSEVSQIKLQNTKINVKSNEGKKIQTLFSGQQTNFQARQVVKSPSGYYSPRNLVSNNGQKTKVFIQYKSPGKDAFEPIKQTVNVKKSIVQQNSQVKKEELPPKKEEPKLPATKTQEKKQVKPSELDQISFSIHDKNLQTDPNISNLEGSAPLNMKAVQKDVPVQKYIETQTFAVKFDIPEHVVKAAPIKKLNQLSGGKTIDYMQIVQTLQLIQKIATKKQEPIILKDIQKLKQIKKESDKAIVEISSEKKEKKQFLEQEIVTLQAEPVTTVFQSIQQVSLQSSAELINKKDVKIIKSSNGESLNESINRSRSKRKRDFLDEVMEVNKVFNHEEHKDYATENKYLDLEDGYDKN